MDPNACLRRIIDAARANDRSEYIQACEDLADWIQAGGFKPAIPPGTRYIPGANTPWALLCPMPDTNDKWILRRYTPNGAVYASYELS